MARDTTDQTPVTSLADLTEYLAEGNKPKDRFRIGTEHEKFAFFKADNSPVPYFGEASISALLNGMAQKSGWEPIIDAGNIIGLAEHSGQGAISLEPGGQFELSGAPLENLHQTCKESNRHLADLREIAEPLGIRFLGIGGQPEMDAGGNPAHAEIALRHHEPLHAEGRQPGSRHDVPHLHDPGEPRLFLGRRHAPQDAGVAEAAAAVDGAVCQLALYRRQAERPAVLARRHLARHRQPARRRAAFVFNADFGFEDYVEWALDVPMYFVVRDGRYHDCTHVTFRQFMNGALKGEIADWEPNMGDWTNHLSTLFPDVRLKRFLEMRGADGGPWRRICALPAFWVGLLYDDAALDAAEDLTRDWTYEETLSMRNAVPAQGLNALHRGIPLFDMAREVINISRLGLKNRNRLNGDEVDESIFLAPLDEVLAKKATLAEDLLARYNGRWNGSVEPVFADYQY